MKKLFSVCVVLFFSLLLVNCGSGDLTSGKAKDIIDGEIDALVNKVKEAQKADLDEETLNESEKKVEEIKAKIKVEGVRKEGDSFIAKINIPGGKMGEAMELKFNKYDSGWKIDELKIPGGKWMDKAKVVQSMEDNLKRALFVGKLKATMGDMKSIGTCIESYITDNYLAPQVENLEQLKDHVVPFHIKVLPLKDAWGNNFFYKRGDVGTDKQDYYWIGSGGSDGKFDGFDQSGNYDYSKGKDIIFHNGTFTYGPKTH